MLVVLDAPSITAVYYSSSSFMGSCSFTAALGIANPKTYETLL